MVEVRRKSFYLPGRLVFEVNGMSTVAVVSGILSRKSDSHICKRTEDGGGLLDGLALPCLVFA